MRKSLLFLLCLSLLVFTSGILLAQEDSLGNTGDLRVINALIGLGPVDVYVNDLQIGASLAPGEATPFLSLDPGQYNVSVYVAGVDTLSPPIADVLIDLPPGESKSAVAYETRFSSPNSSAVDNAARGLDQAGTFMVLTDNRSPLTLGQTRLTAVHLAQSNPGKLSIAYPSRASLLHEISLEQPYGDIDISAGVYPLTIVDADSPDLTRLAFIGDQVFESNVHYTLIIVPDLQIDQSAQDSTPRLPVLSTRPNSLRGSRADQPAGERHSNAPDSRGARYRRDRPVH